ncbi:MAG: hypothetical protein ACRERU_09550 [Methylococcales bacterium]
MKRLETSLTDFLRLLGRLDDIKLGADEHQVNQPTEEDITRLKTRVCENSKFNRTILILYIVSVCVLYVLGVFLVFHFIDSPDVIGVVFGGTFLSLIGVTERLYRVWREKTIIDVMLTIIDDLPPSEAIKSIE